jgi:hypothetical protein
VAATLPLPFALLPEDFEAQPPPSSHGRGTAAARGDAIRGAAAKATAAPSGPATSASPPLLALQRAAPNELPTLACSLRPLLACLSVDHVLVAFECLLAEEKVPPKGFPGAALHNTGAVERKLDVRLGSLRGPGVLGVAPRESLGAVRPRALRAAFPLRVARRLHPRHARSHARGKNIIQIGIVSLLFFLARAFSCCCPIF